MSLIVLKKGTRDDLMAAFGVSNATITYALHFKRESLRARQIRSFAVNTLNAYTLL